MWQAKTGLSHQRLLLIFAVSTSLSSVYHTSSTAQGGGGSFKNGKPIGEVSWCDAKMAERTHWWIERWLSVSPFLSLFLSFSLCLSFAIYLQSYLSSHLPIYLSIHVSIDRFAYSPIYLTVYLSVYPAIHPSTYFSLLVFFPSISSSIHVHSYPSPCSSFCFPFICLSV